MSMKAILLAAATAATLLAPAVASAQDFGRYRADDRRIEARRWHDGDHRAYAYGYAYPTYRYAPPIRHERDWRRERWLRDHRWERDHDRRY